MFFMTVGSSLFLENTSSSESSKLRCCYKKREGRNLALVSVKGFVYISLTVSVLGFIWETKPNPFQQAQREPGVALHKYNRYFICVPKYLVSHYNELPETGYWRLGRFITIFVVISKTRGPG